MTLTVEELLAEARAGLTRLTPEQSAAAAERGAVLVDIRPYAFRAGEGEIAGALVVERNVLEWRFAPDGEWRLPEAGADVQVVVFCNEGYTSSLATSSLAAHALRRLGVHRAADMIDGFRAWRAAALPTVEGGSPALR